MGSAPPPIVEASLYILIPVIFLVLLLLFLRRKMGIKVTVFKVKQFTSARDKSIRYKYTCGYFTEVLVKGPADVVKPAGAADGALPKEREKARTGHMKAPRPST